MIGAPTGTCHIMINLHNPDREYMRKITTRLSERRLIYVTVLGCIRTSGHLYQKNGYDPRSSHHHNPHKTACHRWRRGRHVQRILASKNAKSSLTKRIVVTGISNNNNNTNNIMTCSIGHALYVVR